VSPIDEMGLLLMARTVSVPAHKNQQGLSMDIPNHLLCAQRRIQISQELLIDVPNHFLYFLYVYHREQKARGSRSTFYIAFITFSTRITAYKK
jgi:hypothetical protein